MIGGAGIVLITFIALGAGVFLLLLGLRPRRRGETPYCRRCSYNLTMLESNRCPECGTPLTDGAIVRGRRVTRRGRIAAGIVLLSLGAAWQAAYPALRRVDWYRRRPTGWVLDDLVQWLDARRFE